LKEKIIVILLGTFVVVSLGKTLMSFFILGAKVSTHHGCRARKNANKTVPCWSV